MSTLLVTGGSRGIGAACCVLAAQSGWNVGVNFTSNADAAASVVEGIEASGGRAIAVRGDVSSERDVLGMYDALEQAFGPVAGVVNNAGILTQASSFDKISIDRWEEVQRINATGAFLVAREAVIRMRASGTCGSIVNMSSMAAPLGAANEFVDYAASKGAVESMTLGMAKEVAPMGIRVNAIRPGLIDTEMQASSGDADRAHRLAGSVPLGRAGTATEVAEAAIWLLSAKSSYVTGAILPVSGGR